MPTQKYRITFKYYNKICVKPKKIIITIIITAKCEGNYIFSLFWMYDVFEDVLQISGRILFIILINLDHLPCSSNILNSFYILENLISQLYKKLWKQWIQMNLHI